MFFKFLIFAVAKGGLILLLKSYRMKNRLLLTILAALSFIGPAMADIQSPPGHHFNWSRKLSRGLGGMIFSPLEFPSAYSRTLEQDGAVAAVTDFFVEGTKRAFVRFGYGLYETATFPFPSWKLTYRPPFYRKDYVDSWWGYSEFPLNIGALSQTTYSRSQKW